MMRLGKLAISAALLGGVGTVQAADLPARVAAPPPAMAVPAPVYNWTGFYIGANGGYGWSSASVTINGVTADGGDLKGPFAGGQVGFNYQTGMFVFGVEADGQWANIKETTTIAPFTFTDTINYFFTVRGRLGVATNNILFYGTGGYAHIGAKSEITNGVATASTSGDRGGWTAGGGAEVGFGNFSLKAEYLYIQTFDKDDVILGVPFTMRVHVHTAKIGLNYRFGGGGPVVARY